MLKAIFKFKVTGKKNNYCSICLRYVMNFRNLVEKGYVFLINSLPYLQYTGAD